MVRIKICGLTNPTDALVAAELGADALGFVFAPSPRRVTPDEARAVIRRLPPLVQTVGVFVNEPLDKVEAIRDYCGLDLIQLHGDEDEAYAARFGRRAIKAVRVGPGSEPDVRAFPEATLLLDALSPDGRGGLGQSFDWNLAVGPARRRPIILAGGLNPDNVTRAIKTVRPFAVDVNSGVEAEAGRKDHEKLARFIHRAKAVG